MSFFFKQKTAYEMLISDWSSVVCSSDLPVMVWLHGGGFFVGSGGDAYYEGSNLSRENDVIVVTLNHRLNAFGYLHLGPEAGPQYADSNLAGMLDIVQALKWVIGRASCRERVCQYV